MLPNLTFAGFEQQLLARIQLPVIHSINIFHRHLAIRDEQVNQCRTCNAFEMTQHAVQLHITVFKYPDYPVALGVIRDVADATYDERVAAQVEEVSAKAKFHNVDALLRSGSTWEVK